MSALSLSPSAVLGKSGPVPKLQQLNKWIGRERNCLGISMEFPVCGVGREITYKIPPLQWYFHFNEKTQ